ncbi:hypothetical protein [Nonomuraea rubra]|uniref:hypothetical protein n=1 Tax=Nonomuraea rubra TaxID=46180 RepID=UPI0031E56335
MLVLELDAARCASRSTASPNDRCSIFSTNVIHVAALGAAEADSYIPRSGVT